MVTSSLEDRSGGSEIQRLSRRLRQISHILVFAIPLTVLWVWTHLHQVAGFMPGTAGVSFEPSQLGALQLALGFGAQMIPGAVAMWGCWRLRRLFGWFELGRYFDAEAIRCVQQFSTAAFLYGIAAPVSRTLIALAVSWNNPPGERVLLVSLSSNDIAILFIGGVFLLIARVWRQARDLADENASFV